MIRLALLPLLLGAILWLAAGLVRDHRRRRREALLESLAPAFLHGAPLAPEVRLAALTQIECQGLCLSLPTGWQMAQGGASVVCLTDPAGEIRLAIDALAAEQSGNAPGGDREESASEVLPSGARLTRALRIEAGDPADLLVYEWRLTPPSPEAQRRAYRLRLTAPARAAGGIFLQSDLATLDRAARAARWLSGASSSPTARV